MPPSGHSSSSHSSSSHSSSSHSSSRSSYSSSSRSSSSRSYSSSSRSSSRGPSSHSSSSHSSSSGSSRSSAPSRPMRPRVNQPGGYKPTGGTSPRYVYGRRHDYIYYPVAWIDEGTGTRYEKGYYDENGQRYDDVAFSKNGSYENVLCHCPYCERDTILNLKSAEVAKSLQCPNCGGTMEIQSQLDDYVGADSDTAAPTRDIGANQRPRRRLGCLIPIVIFLLMGFIGSLIPDSSEPDYLGSQPESSLQQIAPYGDSDSDTLALRQVSGNAYSVGGTEESADKLLTWDYAADSYYDAASDCWLWQNVYVDPPVWQYWYEGISSNYGDYGWMEHDEDGWWIEASEGDWIALPGNYDTGGLWYLVD